MTYFVLIYVYGNSISSSSLTLPTDTTLAMANPWYMPLPHVLYTPHVVVLGHQTMRVYSGVPKNFGVLGTWLAYITWKGSGEVPRSALNPTHSAPRLRYLAIDSFIHLQWFRIHLPGAAEPLPYNAICLCLLSMTSRPWTVAPIELHNIMRTVAGVLTP